MEQVYLSGMTKAKDLVGELVPLANSWLRPPQVKMNGIEPTHRVHAYDVAERAYILPCGEKGARTLELTLAASAEEDDKAFIVNPVRYDKYPATTHFLIITKGFSG
jgi:hypothetical protein